MLSYWSGVATLTGIYLIATLGVSILVGFTGLFSLGHAGFMAIGAYGTALSIKLLHMPFFSRLSDGNTGSYACWWADRKSDTETEGRLFCHCHVGNWRMHQIAD